MAEKILNSRIIQKHDIAENWEKAVNFIPKQGEIIIYDPDNTHMIARFKIGDGNTKVNNLPFIGEIDESLTKSGVAADAKVVGDALAEKQPAGDYALRSEIPTVLVQSVNNKVGAVILTPEDIGAQVAGNYITEETDPTVPAWAKATTKPTYTASEVGADPVGTATSAVAAHNTATDAHNDIRLLIEGLTTRLNTLADSDDTTLDQMSEIVTYIKSNKSLIEDVTTNKVNVSDIIDNLTTNVTNKPLSAAQGVALKALIDSLDTDKLDASALTSAVNGALAQAKASGEFDGADGMSATHSWNGTTLTVTSASGTSSANLKGDPGENGADGVGVSSVKQTTTSTADDGNNVITVTLSNGTTSTFTVQNGSKGSKGDKGDSPVRGTDYWTDADKAEIKSYVDEAILGGAW